MKAGRSVGAERSARVRFAKWMVVPTGGPAKGVYLMLYLWTTDERSEWNVVIRRLNMHYRDEPLFVLCMFMFPLKTLWLWDFATRVDEINCAEHDSDNGRPNATNTIEEEHRRRPLPVWQIYDSAPLSLFLVLYAILRCLFWINSFRFYSNAYAIHSGPDNFNYTKLRRKTLKVIPNRRR